MTDQEWESFWTGAAADYSAIVSQYGEAANDVMRAIGSAASSSDPATVIRNMAAAVESLGAAAGPAGEIASGIVAGMMKVAEWLIGTWPAAPDYNNRDALLRVSQALGYRSVADMARDGWVGANLSSTSMGGRRTESGGVPETPRDVAAHLLGPLEVRGETGQFVIPEQARPIAYGRADSLLSKGGLRIISYQSQVSRRQTYTAICVRLPDLPAAFVSQLRVYFPLLLTVDPLNRESFVRPAWWPQKDAGLSLLLLMSLQWAWADAPQQEVPGVAPLSARKLAEGLAGSTRIVMPAQLRGGRPRPGAVPLARPDDSSAAVALGVLAALKFLF